MANASAVTFSDNLGGPKYGCGLLGFARTGFWYYARHDTECKPGLWVVKLHGGCEMGEFWTMCTKVHCVVDDFGTLRKVQ